jgi:hypothetical protein
MNITIWLADTPGTVSHVAVEDVKAEMPVITVSPNPSTNGVIAVATSADISNATITITGITGNVVLQKAFALLKNDEQATFKLNPGFYLVKVATGNSVQTSRVIVY